MTGPTAGSSFRAIRTLALPAMALTVALSLTVTAGAGPAAADTAAPTTASVGSLQVQAQELAGEIVAEGRALDQLSASYESARIRYTQLSARQAALRASMAAASAAVATAHQALKEQAILEYLAGGAPIIGQIPTAPGTDRSLTVAYAEIVSGGQQTALQNYRATLDAQARQKASLDAAGVQVQAALVRIQADQAQAATTMAAQQHALAQVKGELAVEVAKVQAQQQAAEQAQQQARLSSQGDQPAIASAPPTPGSGAQAPTSSSSTTRPSRGSSSPTTSVTSGSGGGTGGSTSPTTFAPSQSGGGTGGTGSSGTTQAPGVDKVLSYARAQLGKPYQWGGAGPDSFDCSGLVMMAWEQAGIYFPHLAQDQYDMTARIPLSALIPGDLVFFGTPDDVYHVGIYVGNGNMIDAPETGQDVQVQSIYWTDLLGAGRVTTSS